MPTIHIKVKLVLGALVSLLLFCACQKDRAEAGRDPLDENYELIDRGDCSQAIQNLQELSLMDSRPAVRVALASAYAARGGIRIESYWGFIIGFAAPLIPPDSIPVNGGIVGLQKFAKQTKGNIGPLEVKALGGIMSAMTVWDRYKDRVDAIPVVSGQALIDLRLAIDALGMDKTPGGRLYRGILNLILFKSHITAAGSFWIDFNKVIEQLVKGNIQVLCRFNFDELLKWLNPVSYHLTETLNDLIIAFPEDRKDLEPSRVLIQSVFKMATDGVDELREKRTCQ
jgi:hypothetical protein